MIRLWPVLLCVLLASAVAGCLSPDGADSSGAKPSLADFEDCEGPIPGDAAPLCETHFTPMDTGQELPDDWYCVHRMEVRGPGGEGARVMEVYRSPTGDAFGVWWTVDKDLTFSGHLSHDRGGSRWYGNFTGGNRTDFVRVSSPLEDGDSVGLMLYRTPYETDTPELQGGHFEVLWNWSDDGGFHVTHRLQTDDGVFYFPGNDLRSYGLDGRDFNLTIRFPKYMDVGSGGVSLVTPQHDCHQGNVLSGPTPAGPPSGVPG